MGHRNLRNPTRTFQLHRLSGVAKKNNLKGYGRMIKSGHVTVVNNLLVLMQDAGKHHERIHACHQSKTSGGQ